MSQLKGTSLVGGSVSEERVDNDFYATDPKSVSELLKVETFVGEFLEPCVGQGPIAEEVKNTYGREIPYIYSDIVDRGYPETLVSDFLLENYGGKKFDSIITNPPYSLAQEFVEKSISLLNPNGKVAMFLKIQFLEGLSRKEMFKKYPPKKIYVFSKRQSTFRNGVETDKNGKKWATTMCHAWFIWEKGFVGKPTVDWI